MPKGRKPQSTALKLLKGNPGKRPLNENEPKPELKIPPCPDHLDDVAKKEWRRISKVLHRLGLLSELDQTALAMYCDAYSRWVEAKQKVKGRLIVKTSNGNPIQNPYLGVANTAWKQMHTMLGEFGMTPSARSRIIAGGRDMGDPGNPTEPTKGKSRYFA